VADGGPSFRPEDFSLGEGLERLLDILARDGLVIGARERTAAHLLAVQEMESAGAADRATMAPANERALMSRLAPVLAPLLARTREERERYFRVVDQLYPPERKVSPETGGGSTGDSIKPRRPWLLRHWGKLAGAGLALLFLAGTALLLLSPDPKAPTLAPDAEGVSTTEITGSVASTATSPQVEESAPQTSDRLLTRVMAAAEAHDGAPTVREIARRVSGDEESLARAVAAGTDPGWTPDAYSQRLAELTGLPQDRPLPLYGRAGDTAPGLLWARLAQGLGRIEQPGLEPPLSQLEAEAGAALAGAPRPRAYRVLDQLRSTFPDPAALSGNAATPAMNAGEIASELIKGDVGRDDARKIGEGPGDDIARALAMAGYPTIGFAHLPWGGDPIRPASTPPPAWLPWAALALPLLAALWLARSLFLMRPYLRRRPPRIPPTHTELVSEAGKRASVDAGYFQRVAQRLRVRTSRPSTEIDIAATIAATLNSGGVMIEPVQANARARPDYLVLVERVAAGDHDAMRMQRLIERLSELVDLDIYAFQYDPGEIEPWGGGRRITIEEAQARHPDHRLIVLGTGIGLLDPVTHVPREAARKLMYWPRRVLLTPVPLAEWGREEYALAEGLAMPVGRATAEGLQFLAELLGLEGGEAEAQPDPRGDGLARPLPDLLRHRPQRFLFNNPPDNATVSRLVVELHNALTPAEFDWFAALAIYPSIQWDLTLFLGVYLPLRETDAVVLDPPTGPPERQKLQAPAEPLYGESRLAAISQLPWLRAGKMPNWLRTVLIRELSPKRTAQVRVVLQKALESSRLRDAATREEEAVFRIAEDRVKNEPRKEALPPGKVFEDDVLLDFLAGSQRTDFVLPRLPRIDGRFLRNFWQQLGAPGGLASLSAIFFALAAFAVAPRGPDPVLTGAYGPLLVLAAGAVLAAALWRPAALGRNMAGWLERLAPGVFAIGLATLAVGGAFATPIVARLLDALAPAQSVLNDAPERGWPAAAIMMLALTGAAIAGLLLARWLGERMALRIHASPLGTLRQGLVLIGKALVLGAASYLLLQVGAAMLPAGTAFAAGLAPLMLAAAGVLASRFAPDSDTIARATAREERGTGLLPAGLRIALAAVPLAAALGLFASISLSHSRVQLLAGADAGAPPVRPERIAIAGDGGAIVAVEASGRMVLSRADGTFIGAANAEVPLTALTIGGGPDARRVAYADASGRVFVWPAGGSPQRVEVDGVQLQSRGAPAQLAFGEDGMLLAATEGAGTDGGGVTRLTLGNSALAAGDLGAPPAALTWLDDASWALATLDGEVRLGASSTTAAELATAMQWGPEFAGIRPAARMMSVSGDRSGNRELHLVGVDGALLKASEAAGQWSAITRSGENAAFRLGSAKAWSERSSSEARLSDPARAVTQRLALVIANADYLSLNDLRGPPESAALVSQALRDIGYSVIGLNNADRARMLAEIGDLEDRIRASGGGANVVVYYSGIGGDRTFGARLVPVDASRRARSEDTLGFRDVLAQLVAADARAVVGIYDSDRGAADDRLTGALIAYAGEPSSAVLDTSTYAAELATAIRIPGLEAGAVFERVLRAVARASNGEQRPVVLNGLATSFVFAPATPDPAEQVQRNLFQRTVAEPDPSQRCGAPVSSEVLFGPGSAVPDRAAIEAVRASFDRATPAGCSIGKAELFGYAAEDERDPDDLALRRAQAVGDLLVAAGAPAALIEARRRSSAEEALDQATVEVRPAFRQQTRRVELRLVAVKADAAALAAGTIFRDRIASSPQTPVPEMVVIPAGRFMMGSPASEVGRDDDEGPQRRVTVPAFAAGKFEVTWDEYQACVEARGGCKAAEDDGFGGGKRPVTNVSWEDAQAYVDWLTRETGHTYRLLSESEWEYAARAGSTGRWSFGDNERSIDSYAWYDSNSRAGTHPVGAKKANAFGLHDMHGNVREWVEDCYAAYDPGKADALPVATDDPGKASQACSVRVVRGGSRYFSPQDLRSAGRSRLDPTVWSIDLGFRVARTLSSTP
jgi:formylglycine-generating enzyme required for sulfatase activity